MKNLTPDELYKIIGQNVAKYRKEKGLSQLDLSLAMGYKSVSVVSGAEIYYNGKHFNLEISLADEAKVQILTKEDLSVFDLEHPRPSNAIMGNDAIIKSLSKYK